MTRLGGMAGVIAAVLVLSACGGDDQEEQVTSTPDELLVIVTLTPVPSATVRSEIISYIVEEGDTLFGIAEQFEISPEAIEVANDLPNRDSIFVGQTLSIPVPGAATPEP